MLSICCLYVEITSTSESPEENLDHIRQVLTTLRKNTLFIKMLKCFWAYRENEYLGFIAWNGNVPTSPSKVAAMKDWPLPETQKQSTSYQYLLWLFVRFIVSLFTTLRNVGLH